MLPDFLLPLIVGLIIQFVKIIFDFFEKKKFHIENLRRAGGFPSVHSGISSSIAVLMLLKYGLYSPEFSITFIFALLFWYDAMNIRYEAGQHAKYLNKISKELKLILDQTEKITLKERLGHTMVEVIGGIVFGILLTIILYFLFIKF